MHVQCPGLGVERGLGPVHPDTKAKTLLVSLVGDIRQAVRKLLRVGIPVAYAAKPARVDVKHLHTEFLRFGNHAQGEGLVHGHCRCPNCCLPRTGSARPSR